MTAATMSGSYPYEILGPVLQVRNLQLKLGGKPILQDLSFTVHDVRRPGFSQGQIVAILGPSGVGKSQLFRRIAGLDLPDSGQILIGLEAKPTAAGLVGVVMQHYPLLLHRSVLDNLLVAGRQAGFSAAAARMKADDLLGRFGLQARGGAWPAELSGGQRQRVAIAQQLMCSEHFLLMDEPFSGLDPLMKQRACELVQHVASLHEENTIVVVTHDIASAVKICDQILVLGREAGNDGTGARIRADLDLKARGIAWRPHNEQLPAFIETVREIEALFPTL